MSLLPVDTPVATVRHSVADAVLVSGLFRDTVTSCLDYIKVNFELKILFCKISGYNDAKHADRKDTWRNGADCIDNPVRVEISPIPNESVQTVATNIAMPRLKQEWQKTHGVTNARLHAAVTAVNTNLSSVGPCTGRSSTGCVP
jgi:hypothetical protein